MEAERLAEATEAGWAGAASLCCLLVAARTTMGIVLDEFFNEMTDDEGECSFDLLTLFINFRIYFLISILTFSYMIISLL